MYMLAHSHPQTEKMSKAETIILIYSSSGICKSITQIRMFLGTACVIFHFEMIRKIDKMVIS